MLRNLSLKCPLNVEMKKIKYLLFDQLIPCRILTVVMFESAVGRASMSAEGVGRVDSAPLMAIRQQAGSLKPLMLEKGLR